MKIQEKLQEYALAVSQSAKVSSVCIGLGYTAVLLDDGRAGVAYTFREEKHQGCSVFQGRRPLAGSSAAELVNYITSPAMIERTVGIATANALINTADRPYAGGDALDCLDIRPDDAVGMIGYFGPLIAPLQKRVKSLLVFERNGNPIDGVYPEEAAARLLPTCTVALITSTSIINNTIDSLLQKAAGCRIKALLGASTPLAPEVFKPQGVNLLSGVVVTDPQGILRVVSEGGGMRFFKNHIQKVNLL